MFGGLRGNQIQHGYTPASQDWKVSLWQMGPDKRSLYVCATITDTLFNQSIQEAARTDLHRYRWKEMELDKDSTLVLEAGDMTPY